MKTTLIISALISVLVSAGIWLALPAKQPTVAHSLGNTSIDGSQANLPNPSNYDYLVARLALGLGTNLSNIDIGAQEVAINNASTTVCAIQNPLAATSTITMFSMVVSTATSTATSYAIGTSTNQFATSTSMETASVGANQQGTISWAGGLNNSVIGPSQWITVGNAQGQLLTPFATGGTCAATFQSAQ